MLVWHFLAQSVQCRHDRDWLALKLQQAFAGERSVQCHTALHFDPGPTRITGWYDGSDGRWSTDRKRQKHFDDKRDARRVCLELRHLWPRHAKVINIELEQNAPEGGAPDVLS
jgi:hypothetical protein